MAQSANVTNTGALQRLRAALVIYIEKAGITIDEVTDDARRIRFWLQGEKLQYWKKEYKSRMKKLEEARSALLSARLGNLTEVSMLHQMAVKRAERDYHEAEEKIRKIKRWLRDYEQKILPMLKQLDKFRTVVSADLPKGVAYLDGALDALEAYNQIKAPTMNDITATESVDLDQEQAEESS
ncbi:MAG: hypothetical protein CMO80_12210 [Verrucomicrobiales bacterium]|nr:hypothetical protein [Verrucomicrobiales bacterium]|tara:strand:- start:3406 stop:3951 length:546 start_codon:yes stop_codon:yes gene_type:complete